MCLLEEEGPCDISFQRDPEHYEFACLSMEEAWNFLDAQACEASRMGKVRTVHLITYWVCLELEEGKEACIHAVGR